MRFMIGKIAKFDYIDDRIPTFQECMVYLIEQLPEDHGIIIEDVRSE